MIRDGREMVRLMRPERMPGVWIFQSVAPEALPALAPRLRALFHEGEGPSVVLSAEPGEPGAMAQITLTVHSALEGVGLTAAVSGALAKAGIACNVIAATHHDHLFVPESRADEALEILRALARET